MLWTSLWRGHITDFCSTCSPGLPAPSLQSCFPAAWPPACTGAWGYSSALRFIELYEVSLCPPARPGLSMSARPFSMAYALTAQDLQS